MTQRSVHTTQRRPCVTQLSVHTTQSKLAVQAPVSGVRGARRKRHPWRYVGSARPCALPRIWGRLHESLLFCLRKDIALV